MKSNVNSEWKEVLKAQVQTSQRLQEEEQRAQQLSKVLYKQELDQQRQWQKELNKPDLAEQEFYQNQLRAIALAEQKRLDEQREKQTDLAKDYERNLKLKFNQAQASRAVEKLVENKLIRDEEVRGQQELERERQRKPEIVRSQRLELKHLLEEKQRKREKELAEKERDKQMILDNMQKMAASEHKFKQFYEGRLAKRENRMAGYQPVPFTNTRSESLLRSNDEYNRRKEEEYMKHQRETNARKKAELDALKHTLNRQVSQKYEAKRKEELDNFYEGVKAQKVTLKEMAEDQEKLSKKRRQQSEIRVGLNRQLEERSSLNLRDLSMDDRERVIHRSLLDQINGEQKIGFPGVPGIHSVESPLQTQIHRVYRQRQNPN